MQTVPSFQFPLFKRDSSDSRKWPHCHLEHLACKCRRRRFAQAVNRCAIEWPRPRSDHATWNRCICVPSPSTQAPHDSSIWPDFSRCIGRASCREWRCARTASAARIRRCRCVFGAHASTRPTVNYWLRSMWLVQRNRAAISAELIAECCNATTQVHESFFHLFVAFEFRFFLLHARLLQHKSVSSRSVGPIDRTQMMYAAIRRFSGLIKTQNQRMDDINSTHVSQCLIYQRVFISSGGKDMGS